MRKKENIVFLINDLGMGGAEKVLVTLFPKLKELSQDYRLSVLTIEPVIEFKQLPFKVDSLLKNKTKKGHFYKFITLVTLPFRLNHYMKSHDTDTVISFLALSNYINIVCKYFGRKHKAYISLHSTFEYFEKKNWKRRCHKEAILRLYPRADLVISVSEGVAKAYEHKARLQCPIEVINNPFDIQDIIRKSEAPLKELKINDKNYILSIGRLHVVKRQVDLISAYTKLSPGLREKVALVIVGKGHEKKCLIAHCRNLGVLDRVTFIPFTSNPYAYIKNAWMVCLTSENEAFPMVIPEAMICRTTMISSDCDHGPRDILDGGRHGYLYPVGDIDKLSEIMENCINSKTFQSAKISSAFEHVQEFSVDNIAKKYFDKVISRERGAT